MKNILIVGDSHINQIRSAYQAHKYGDEIKITFISFPVFLVEKVNFSNNSLKVEESNGIWPEHPHFTNEQFNTWYDNMKREIAPIAKNNVVDLTPYDTIIIYGFHLITYHWHSLHDEYYYSTALKNEHLKHRTVNTKHYRFLLQLKDYMLTGRKVYSVMEPLLNELVFHCPEESPYYKTVQKIPKKAHFSQAEPIYSQILSDAGSSFITLPRTIFSDDFKGSDKRFKSARGPDFAHLNFEGGAILMDHLIKELSD